MEILPKMSQCNDLNSCLSFTVLRNIITEEVKFEFPFQVCINYLTNM